MKAEIKTKEKGFEPIELNITIESKEELAELYARLKFSHSWISIESSVSLSDTDETNILYEIIKEEYIKRK